MKLGDVWFNLPMEPMSLAFYHQENSTRFVSSSTHNVTPDSSELLDSVHSPEDEYYLLSDVKRALHKIVTPTLCAFGCAGNLLNLLVLTRIRMRKAEGGKDGGTNLGLILLAISDLLFCITLFPRSFIAETKSLFEKKDFWCLYQVYGTGVVTTFILTSTWITVIMATIRYIGICHPFCFRKIDSYRFARIAYLIVMCSCIILNLPLFFQYQITDLPLPDGVVYLLDIGYLDQDTMRGKVYMWTRFIVATCIPLIVMSFSNISLIKALQKSYRMRKRYHVQETVSSTSNRVTLTLIIIVMFFVLLVLPSELMDFFSDLINLDISRTEIFLFMRAVANILQVLNFSFNFILYCIINVHFRGVLIDLASCGGRLYRSPKFRGRQSTSRTSCSHMSLKSFTSNRVN